MGWFKSKKQPTTAFRPVCTVTPLPQRRFSVTLPSRGNKIYTVSNRSKMRVLVNTERVITPNLWLVYDVSQSTKDQIYDYRVSDWDEIIGEQ